MTNTEQASSKLDNLRALRADTTTELATAEARIGELTEAMGHGEEVNPEEWHNLTLTVTAAREHAKALDVGIKAASEALKAAQWADKLREARAHAAARPDTEGEIRKLAEGIRKKLAAIEAKAVAWNDAGHLVSAGAKASPLRELATEDQWGGAAVIDGDKLADISVHHLNKWVSEALDELDREEAEGRKAAALVAAGPDPYTPRQRMDAALFGGGRGVAAYVEQQRQDAEMERRWQEDVWASMPRSGSGGTDQLFPTTGR